MLNDVEPLKTTPSDPAPVLRIAPTSYLLGEHKKLAFDDDQEPHFPGLTVERTDQGWLVQAAGEIGLFPGTVNGANCLITVIPKGAQSKKSPSQALRYFFQLWLLSEGASEASLANKATWDSVQSSDPSRAFPYFLAVAYSQVLRELVRRDFRRFYVPQSETLKGRVQGRLNTRQHLSNALQGRPLEMPCTWEDFTADNWDNRILKAAMQRLIAHGQRHQLPLSGLFAPLRSAFVDVSDVAIRRQHFQRSQLGRLSSHYRAALRLAWLVITGGRPEAGSHWRDRHQQKRPDASWSLRLSTHSAFEGFCRRLVGEAAQRFGAQGSDKPKLAPLLKSKISRSIEPDLAITMNGRFMALGDAKYKDLIGAIQSQGLSQIGDIEELTLRTGDQYQMYAYMRLEHCAQAFFMVPFWQEGGPAVSVSEPLQFRRSPLDGEAPHALRVLGLNLMVEPTRILAEGSAELARWYGQGTDNRPRLDEAWKLKDL
jgi:5-methylcytosine-specific restriction endonuclease McrBC regulatory subunit McrC